MTVVYNFYRGFEQSEFHLLERMKHPVPRQIRHGVTVEPFPPGLFQAGQEVKREELKFQDEVIPVRHGVPVPCRVARI